MVTAQDIFGAFFVSVLVAFGFTPLARQVAFKIKLLDHPDQRKSHARPMPLLGGLSIFLAFFAGVLFTTDVNNSMAGLFIGGVILVCLGIIDDKLGMAPSIKLSGQILVSLIAYKTGVRVITFEDYYLSMFFTTFWIVGITNAFNLLDNLNGLSSGIAGIAAVFFGIMAWQRGQVYIAVISFSLAGACFGFLRHNFPKAKIFMGDSGSLFLGFMLASIAVLGSWETDKISLSLSLPIIVLGYPIFDTTLVTILRLIEKRPIYLGGRDHSSHILASLGFKKTRAVLFIYLVCILLGLSAMAIMRLPLAKGIIIFIITALGMLSLGVYLALKRLKSAKLKRQSGFSDEK